MTIQTKILIVGDGGVGKTCAIERHFTDYFRKKYITGNEIEKHIFEKGKQKHIIYDYPGQYRHSFSTLTADIGEIDSAVIMFDLTSGISHRNVKQWTKLIKGKFGEVPIKVVGNKSDVVDGIKIKDAKIKTSAKNKTNLELVF